MPDEGRLGQIHKEIEMIREICKEIFVDVLVDLFAQNGRERRELGRTEPLLFKFLFDAVDQDLFTGVAHQGHNAIFVLIENFADQVGQKLHRDVFGSLRRKYTALLEEIPHIDGIDVIPDAELFEVVVALVKRLEFLTEVRDFLFSERGGRQAPR